MKKTIITTIMVICLMSFTLAYYPGETHIFSNEMGIENIVYTIIGNTSEVSPLNVSINSTNITITFPQDMIPNAFDIVFLENQTHEVIQTIHTSSGGGSRTRYVDRNVTVYVPEYINTTTEVEKIIEVPIDNTKIIQTGFETWHILFAMVVGGCFIWFVMRKKSVVEED